MDCLFCKIVNGDIPCTKVYEDDNVLAFRDIDPKAPSHIIVIPKKHFSNILEIKDIQIQAALFDAFQKIAKQEKFDDGFRLVCNTGEQGGQTVEHLHFHILSGRNLQWPPG